MFEFRASTSASSKPSDPELPSKLSKLGFPRSHRLTRGIEIQKVVREGKRIRTAYLDVRISASPFLHPRIGVVVPRYSKSAVERNRLKRRLRELIRVRVLPVAPVADIVIRARSEAYRASFDMLASDVRRLVIRLSS